jgi:hypothetical protein
MFADARVFGNDISLCLIHSPVSLEIKQVGFVNLGSLQPFTIFSLVSDQPFTNGS